MSNMVLRIFLCFVASLQVYTVADAQEQDVLALLRAEGPSAWASVERQAEGFTVDIEVNYREEVPSQSDKPLRRVEYSQRYTCSRLSGHLVLRGKLSFDAAPNSGVVSINPDYTFILARKSDQWLLKRSAAPAAKDFESEFDSWRVETSPAVSIDTRNPETLRDFIQNKNTRLVSASRVNGLVRVVFEASAPVFGRIEETRYGYVDLDEARSWRVVSYQYRQPVARYQVNYKLQYRSDSSSPFDVELFEMRSDAPHGKTFSVVSYSNARKTQPDKTPFYLSHYGLPEPLGITPPSRPAPTYVWLLLAAGGFGVITLACRWLLKRRSKALPPPVPPTTA